MKLALLAMLAACSSAPPPAPAPAPAPEPVPEPAKPTPTDPAPVPAPALGQKCGANDLCAAPATCVSFYGIAGPRGPQFKTCEVRCDPRGKTACPEGTKCTTVADGPGSVCR